METVTMPLCGILAVLTGCFYLLDWVRFRTMLAVFGYGLTLSQGINLTCVSYFVSSLTPTAELNTPAIVLMMRRQGIPGSVALAASMAKSIYVTLWICFFSYVSLFFDHFSVSAVPLPAALRSSLPLLLLPLLFVTSILLLIAFFPTHVVTITRTLGQRFESSQWFQRFLQGLENSVDAIGIAGKTFSRQHLFCHLASITFVCVYILQGYVLANFFGFDLTIQQTITIFSTSLMIVYLSPVPGSIGITEFLTAFMLDPKLAAPSLAVALLLRLCCWYLVVPPGGIILAWVFRKNNLVQKK